jgi:hypothetical protein
MVREQQGPASRRPDSGRGRPAWLGAVLSILVGAPPLFAGSACGSRSLLFVPHGDEGGPAPVSDDASAGGSASGSGGSSSGGGSAYGGSSGGVAPQDAAAGSSSGDAGAFVGNAICTSAADCPAGRVCCATENLVTSCLVGPCPTEAPLQFCATAAECLVKGDVCILLLTEPEDSYQVCTPPASSR